MSGGDSDLNGRVSSMPWFQWSLSVRRYFGEFNQTATRLLLRVEANVEDPIIADNTTMTGAERRLSIRLYCVLALTFWKRALQVVQKVPKGYGFEAWRQLCTKFGQHPLVRSRGMLQALLSSTKSSELKSGDVVSDRQSARPMTWCRWAAEKVTSQRNRRSTSAGRNLATGRVSTGTPRL